MKNDLHKTKKKHARFLEYDENSRHTFKKVKTHYEKKANSAIDKALRQKNLKNLYDMDEIH
jgi:hypothetical protein